MSISPAETTCVFSPLETFPLELIERILGFLDTNLDVANASAVSRLFYMAARNTQLPEMVDVSPRDKSLWCVSHSRHMWTFRKLRVGPANGKVLLSGKSRHNIYNALASKINVLILNDSFGENLLLGAYLANHRLLRALTCIAPHHIIDGLCGGLRVKNPGTTCEEAAQLSRLSLSSNSSFRAKGMTVGRPDITECGLPRGVVLVGVAPRIGSQLGKLANADEQEIVSLIFTGSGASRLIDPRVAPWLPTDSALQFLEFYGDATAAYLIFISAFINTLAGYNFSNLAYCTQRRLCIHLRKADRVAPDLVRGLMHAISRVFAYNRIGVLMLHLDGAGEFWQYLELEGPLEFISNNVEFSFIVRAQQAQPRFVPGVVEW